MASPKSAALRAPALQATFEELLERTSWDLPADLDRALNRAIEDEISGTNGRAGLLEVRNAIDHARATRTLLGTDPAAIHFIVEAPADVDQKPFLEAATAAAVNAAKSGTIRTNAVDLPNGKPRRGKTQGLAPNVRFRTQDGPIRLHAWLPSASENSVALSRTLPCTEAPGAPSLEGVAKTVIHAIHSLQGQPAGPGIIAVHVGGDPIGGLDRALDQLLRPIGGKHPQRPLVAIEQQIVDGANQLMIGAQGLGGRSTILAAHVGASEAPADCWAISVLATSTVCRRHTVTLDDKGGIARWETTLAESALRTPKEPETASVAELEERATKAAAAEEAARKREAKKAAAGKKAAPKKAPAKKAPAKKAPPAKAAVGTKTKKK